MLLSDKPSDRLQDRAAAERGLGERLVGAGRIAPADLERAMRLAGDWGETLAAVLAKLGLVNESVLAAAMAEELNMPLLGAGEMPQSPVEIDDLSPQFLRQQRILPVSRTAEGHVLAMADPLDSYAINAFRMVAGAYPLIALAEPGLIESAIDRLYADRIDAGDGSGGEPGAVLDDDAEVERLRDMASEAPVIQLVNTLIAKAVERRASDIHFEPFEKEFRVRYRIDGVLQEDTPLPDRLRAAVISRIKIMARLDIAERRLPQDGRIKTVVRGKAIDLRVSTLQIMHGESVVMRILDRESVELDLNALGVGAKARAVLDDVLAAPDGIFMVTGPTGSGKTTSLYASLCAINSPEKKIITVEDPVEYQLAGVNQVQVSPGIGLNFAHVLRSMLRQDPDVILVGEIRDGETARIAAQAALTGHLVLSTLHTNDAASAVTRLVDMGIEEYLLTSALIGVAGQRLVRRLCPDCKEPHTAEEPLIERFGLRKFRPEGEIELYRPVGCEACHGRGYRGRTVIVEILRMTDRVRSLVLRRAEAGEIQQAAIEDGMQTMFEDGVEKALRGITTLEEVLRTTRDG